MIAPAGNRRQRSRPGFYGLGGYGETTSLTTNPYQTWYGYDAAASAVPAGAHPLHDARHNARLLEREQAITRTFGVIEESMRQIAALPHDATFAAQSQAISRAQLGCEFPAQWLMGTWSEPVDMRRLYAYAVFRAFRQLADRQFDRSLSEQSEGEPAAELIRRWGFHAIDISPCADGRLSGVVDYILRVPPTVVVSRTAAAGAMFDIEESVRSWTEVELKRHRESVPNAAAEPTRYLKIGVYHTSSSDPEHEGCAAHGSDTRVAAQSLLDRLNAFATAVENSFCCGASVATLLIGVDTDTDAITVHVPDASGTLSLDRSVDNASLYELTRNVPREEAKQIIRRAVAQAAGVADDDAATEGMRWFCGYLLKNNVAQIEYVRAHHDGRYVDVGHTERFITVGDSFDDVQMRNLAYQAQMTTVEEGAADMDVGIKIFKKVNVAHSLPIPVFVHLRYNSQVPGARERAATQAERLARAIRDRYTALVRDRWLYTFAVIKGSAPESRLEEIECVGAQGGDTHTCQCNKMMESTQ